MKIWEALEKGIALHPAQCRNGKLMEWVVDHTHDRLTQELHVCVIGSIYEGATGGLPYSATSLTAIINAIEEFTGVNLNSRLTDNPLSDLRWPDKDLAEQLWRNNDWEGVTKEEFLKRFKEADL